MLCRALPLVSWVLRGAASALMFQAYRVESVVPVSVRVCVEFRQSPSPLPPPLQVAPVVLTVTPDICAQRGVLADRERAIAPVTTSRACTRPAPTISDLRCLWTVPGRALPRTPGRMST